MPLLSGDFYASLVAELRKQILTIFPRQSEHPDIGQSQTRNNLAQRLCLVLWKLTVIERVFSPIHKLGQRNSVTQIRAKLLRRYFFCY